MGSPETSTRQQLAIGLEQLEPLLTDNGFTRARVDDDTGTGSGGPFARAVLVNDDRRFDLWLRHASLSVTYSIGAAELQHPDYMRELLGPGGPNRFPAYADDTEAAFAALRHDVQHHCRDFLKGSGDEFRRFAANAKSTAQLGGAARLAHIERQLRSS